ncbi:hypothetical protein D3C72_1264250 [compost metagenome]
MPFGLFLALAAIAVTPGLRGGDAQVGDGAAILRPADFGISAHVPDQNYLVYATSHLVILSAGHHDRQLHFKKFATQ